MKHTTWMAIADVIAQQESKCISRQVSAIIVKDDKIVSTGHNGTASGQPNCCDVNDHLVHDGKCGDFVSPEAAHEHHVWSNDNEIHAELNAIMYANPQDRAGATLYTTLEPCANCAKAIANSGITTVIYKEEYHRTAATVRENLRKKVQVYKLSEL